MVVVKVFTPLAVILASISALSSPQSLRWAKAGAAIAVTIKTRTNLRISL